MMLIVRIIFLLVIFLSPANCAKILCIASVPTFSHNLFFRPIWKALADRGHELTVLTANTMEESYPNVKEIDLNFVYETKTEIAKLTWKSYNWMEILRTFEKMFFDVALLELNHPEVQNLLRNETEFFDLVIAEMHIPLMFGFAHRFKCPLVGISSSDILTEHHSLLGNPTHPILFPDVFMAYTENSFVHRLLGVVFRFVREIRRTTLTSSSLDISRKYFGPDTPPLRDLIRNISLVFLNTHPVLNFRPLGPKFITIGGGTHIQKRKALPKDLQSLMDGGTQGIVYFSLGTNVKISQYPSNFINTTIEAFKELPYQIIWKSEYDIPNLPENVNIFNWVPQQDLLRHENVKVFITQGGIHSMEEAICAEVPMIGIPFMSDQNRNVFEIITKKFGVSLDKDAMTKDDLKWAINEVITNPMYKNQVSKTARLLKDQPMTGLQKAVWYTEYIIRNKDAKDVYNNPNLNLPWHQYFLLDTIGLLLVLLIITAYLFRIALRMFFVGVKKICRSVAKNKKE